MATGSCNYNAVIWNGRGFSPAQREKPNTMAPVAGTLWGRELNLASAYRARLRCRLWLHARLGAHVFERQRGHAPLVAAAVKRHVPRFRPAYHPDHGCRSGKRNEMGRGVGALAPGHCPFRPCPNRRDMSSHEQQGIRLRCRRSRLRPWVWRVPLAVGRRQQPHPRRKAHAFPYASASRAPD